MRHALLLAALVGCAAVPAADPTPPTITEAEYDWRVQVTILRKVTEFCRDADPDLWQECTAVIMRVFE